MPLLSICVVDMVWVRKQTVNTVGKASNTDHKCTNIKQYVSIDFPMLATFWTLKVDWQIPGLNSIWQIPGLNSIWQIPRLNSIWQIPGLNSILTWWPPCLPQNSRPLSSDCSWIVEIWRLNVFHTMMYNLCVYEGRAMVTEWLSWLVDISHCIWYLMTLYYEYW